MTIWFTKDQGLHYLTLLWMSSGIAVGQMSPLTFNSILFLWEISEIHPKIRRVILIKFCVLTDSLMLYYFTTTDPVFFAMGPDDITCPCQVVSLMWDHQCSVLKQVWYSFYQLQKDERVNEYCTIWSWTLDLFHGCQLCWSLYC